MKRLLCGLAVAAMVAATVAGPIAQACDQGFAAFQNTVYQKVRRDCAQCHDGTRRTAPPFATADAMASYNQLLSYMNFAKVEESLLVIRAGNGHCGIINCQGESGPEMARLAQQWVDQGEKTCERNGRYFSAEIPVPADLPGKDQGFMTISFELGSIKADLAGASLQIEAQNFVDKSGTLTRGAYRFRSPRIVGGSSSGIYVKNLKILLNGKYDVVYDNYTTIDRTLPFVSVGGALKTATPVMASATMIILKDGLPNPKLSVSFVDLEASSEKASCPNLDGFIQLVQPVLSAQNCSACHKSSSPTLGERVFDLTAPASQMCAAAAALVDANYFMVSPLIEYPSQGLMNHPQLTDAQRYDYVRALKAWLNK